MQKNICNIGVLAHVDAGKTTITENFLYHSGMIKKMGSVDHGNAQTDFLKVEKDRGITVKATNISFDWVGSTINLIDTPGHVDFSSELEKVIRVLDFAVIVISAVEGIQAHTETIWSAIKNLKIPVVFFINKIDRIGADVELVCKEIENELTKEIVILQEATNLASNEANIVDIWGKEFKNETVIETLANLHEDILAKYLEEIDISFEELDKKLTMSVQEGNLFPVLMGSAKNSVGITSLLNCIVKYYPEKKYLPSSNLSALIFKIENDPKLGKKSFVKIYSGAISNRDVVKNLSLGIEEKVTKVVKVYSEKDHDIGYADAGDIVALFGLSQAETGNILGSFTNEIPGNVSLKAPLLTVKVIPENQKDYASLADALSKISNEDPSLDFEWLKDEQLMHIKIMGWMQIEILEAIIEDRFGIKAKLENPSVIYKETPLKSGEGFVRYWMPKPCWAILRFKIEPGERGSGVIYKSKISVDKVHSKYQNEVEQTISSSLKQGIKGWEVTDIKITLIDGEDHEIHSRPGDFKVATPMGIMNGLSNIGTTLLEPLVSYRIVAEGSLLGAITSDITQMRGTFESPIIMINKFELKGILPVATSVDFPVRLSSRSGGKAKIITQFYGYQECSDEEGIIRPYRGISPLDTSKWILKARKAIQ